MSIHSMILVGDANIGFSRGQLWLLQTKTLNPNHPKT